MNVRYSHSPQCSCYDCVGGFNSDNKLMSEISILKKQIMIMEQNVCTLNEQMKEIIEKLNMLWYNPGPGGPGYNMSMEDFEKHLSKQKQKQKQK